MRSRLGGCRWWNVAAVDENLLREALLQIFIILLETFDLDIGRDAFFVGGHRELGDGVLNCECLWPFAVAGKGQQSHGERVGLALSHCHSVRATAYNPVTCRALGVVES